MIINVTHEENFLEKVAEIVLQRSDKSWKVILPTVATCRKLKQIIIEKAGACILPQIVPVINLEISSEDIYEIPGSYTEPISLLEQRLLVAKIIQDIDSSANIIQALNLSRSVINLSDEFVEGGVDIADIKDKALVGSEGLEDVLLDCADHWRQSAGFLQKIHHAWRDILTKRHKIDLSEYRKNILQLEIRAAKEATCNHILAGVFPNGELMLEFTKCVASSDQSYFIPPPHLGIGDMSHADYRTHYNYHVLQLHKAVIPAKGGIQPSISRDPCVRQDDNITTSENLRAESEVIVAKILEWHTSDPQQSIAVVTKNDTLLDLCHNLLSGHNIPHINFQGYSIANTKPYELFILLADSASSDNIQSSEKFIALLKNPYLFSSDVSEFEINLRKNMPISDSSIHKILESLKSIPRISGMMHLLTTHITIAQDLVPHIWNSTEGKALSEFLYTLLQTQNTDEISIKDYVELIKAITKDVKYHKNPSSEKVLFMSLEDANLGGFGQVILSDVNEGSMPSKLQSDPWMNSRMRQNLGLKDKAEKIGMEWYHFKSLLARERVYITRSSKKNGVETQCSRFIQELNIRA